MELVQTFLIAAAREKDAAGFTGAADYVLDLLDPDGTEPKDQRANLRRGIDLGPQERGDLSSEIGGRVTARMRVVLEAIFARLARPGVNNPGDPDSIPARDALAGIAARITEQGADRDAKGQDALDLDLDPGPGTSAPGAEAVAAGIDLDRLAAAARRDLRDAGQRRHDALLTILESGLATRLADSPDGRVGELVIVLDGAQLDFTVGAGRSPVPDQARATVLEPELKPEAPGPGAFASVAPALGRVRVSGRGSARTSTGYRISVREALALAVENPAYLLLVDAEHCPLYLGRTRRLASAAQRIALFGSERGCSAPGCGTPAAYCQVHHAVRGWAEGGVPMSMS